MLQTFFWQPFAIWSRSLIAFAFSKGFHSTLTIMSPARAASKIWLRAAFSLDNKTSNVSLGLPPAFLCPIVQRTSARAWPTHTAPQSGRVSWVVNRSTQRRCLSGLAMAAEPMPVPLVDSSANSTREHVDSTVPCSPQRQLPLQCPGCGAFSQTVHAGQPGYFDLERQSTMAYLGMLPERKLRIRQEDKVIQETIRRLELEHGGEDVLLRSLLRGPEKTAEVAAALGRQLPGSRLSDLATSNMQSCKHATFC